MGGGNSEKKGRGKSARCSTDLGPLTEAGGEGKLFSPRRQSYPAFAAPAQQECHLWGFSPSQLSLHKEKKIKRMQEMGREVQTRENEPARQSHLGCWDSASLFSFQGTVRPPRC